MKVNLVTFGGGNFVYRKAAQQLKRQATNSKQFKNVVASSDRSLLFDSSFFLNYQKFIKENKKGYGFWIWKPYLISKYLKKMKKDDLLIYLDAGCRLNFSTKNARTKFGEYIELAFEHSSLAGQLKNGEWGQKDLTESAWTKAKVFDFIDMSTEKISSNQIQAGWQFYRKTSENVEFIENWLSLCSANNFELLRDASVSDINYPNFIEHRHDQSIFSCLYKKYDKFTISDDTWWDPDWDTLGSNYPIWAMRAQRKLDYEYSKYKIKA